MKSKILAAVAALALTGCATLATTKHDAVVIGQAFETCARADLAKLTAGGIAGMGAKIVAIVVAGAANWADELDALVADLDDATLECVVSSVEAALHGVAAAPGASPTAAPAAQKLTAYRAALVAKRVATTSGATAH